MTEDIPLFLRKYLKEEWPSNEELQKALAQGEEIQSIALKYQKMILVVIKKYFAGYLQNGGRLTFWDLYQEGNVGLLKELEGREPDLTGQLLFVGIRRAIGEMVSTYGNFLKMPRGFVYGAKNLPKLIVALEKELERPPEPEELAAAAKIQLSTAKAFLAIFGEQEQEIPLDLACPKEGPSLVDQLKEVLEAMEKVLTPSARTLVLEYYLEDEISLEDLQKKYRLSPSSLSYRVTQAILKVREALSVSEKEKKKNYRVREYKKKASSSETRTKLSSLKRKKAYTPQKLSPTKEQEASVGKVISFIFGDLEDKAIEKHLSPSSLEIRERIFLSGETFHSLFPSETERIRRVRQFKKDILLAAEAISSKGLDILPEPCENVSSSMTMPPLPSSF